MRIQVDPESAMEFYLVVLRDRHREDIRVLLVEASRLLLEEALIIHLGRVIKDIF